MFTFEIVLGNGEKLRFNNWNDAIEYLNNSNIKIKHSDREFGYWGLSDGGHMTRD